MDIIIHRQWREDLHKVFKEVLSILKNKNMNAFIDAFIDERKLIIIVNDKCINFWCSPYWCMGGAKPKYYNTDSVLASEFLHQGASKVGGYEVDDLEELVNLFIK